MASYCMNNEQLNFLKLSAIIVDEFPTALLQTFSTMWNTKYSIPWDDSTTARKRFQALESAKTKTSLPFDVPMKKWDCTSLIGATIYAQSFAVMDHQWGATRSLSKVYVEPKKIPFASFHPNVKTGNRDETIALAIDQLRRVRNTIFHQAGTTAFDKPTFDYYLSLVKDAFAALGISSTMISDISSITEDDFPIEKIRRLEKRVAEEQNSIISFLEDDVLQCVEQNRNEVLDKLSKMETLQKDELLASVQENHKEIMREVESLKMLVRENVLPQIDHMQYMMKAIKQEMTPPSASLAEPHLQDTVCNVHGNTLGDRNKGNEGCTGIGSAFHGVDHYHTTVVDHQKTFELQQIANRSYNMGCSYYQLGDYHSALDLHKKALALRQEILGDCMMTADSHNEVGRAYYQLGDYYRALESHKKDLEMRQKLLAQQHQTLDSTYKLGSTDFEVSDILKKPTKKGAYAPRCRSHASGVSHDVTGKSVLQIRKEEETGVGTAYNQQRS